MEPIGARLRTRYFALFSLIAFAVSVVAIPILGNQSIVIVAIGQILIGVGAVLECKRAGVKVGAFFVGPITFKECLRYIFLAVPLVLTAIGGFFLLWGPISYVSPSLVEQMLADTSQTSELLSGPVYLELILAFLVGPAVEEFIFRGLLFRRWAYKWGTRTAAVALSIIFAALHDFDLFGTIFGLVMSALFLKTGSLLGPITCHASHNILITPSMFWFAERFEKEGTAAWIRANWISYASLLPIGLAILFFLRSWWLPKTNRDELRLTPSYP